MMISSLNIGVKKTVYYSMTLFFVLFFSCFFLMTWGINTAYIKNKISLVIYQKTGLQINPAKFSLTIFPHASLNIKDIDFHPAAQASVNIELLKVNIHLQALLQGAVKVGPISIYHPILKIIRHHEKQAILPVAVSVSTLSQGVDTLFSFLPEQQDDLELVIRNAGSQYFHRMDGSIYLSKEKKTIRVDTILKGIIFSSADLPYDFIEKHLDLDSIALDQFKLNATINEKSEIQGHCSFVSPTLGIKGNAALLDSNDIKTSFKFSDTLSQVDIMPFQLNFPKGLVAVHFENDQIKKKSEIVFTGTNIHIDQAKKASLLLFKDIPIVNNIFNILQKGVSPNVTVSFQSQELKDLFDAGNLRLKGNIENGLVNIPRTQLTASDTSGEARIQNGILDIVARRAMVQGSSVEKGTLSVDLLNHSHFPFHGEFFLDVDLSMIPQTLISLLPDTLLSKELSLVHDVTGRSKTRLTLSSDIHTQDITVHITTDDFSVMGNYDRIPGDIVLENINFTYAPDIVVLKHVKGIMNGSKIYDLNTRLNFKNEPEINIDSGSGTIFLDKMIPWLMSFEKTRQLLSPIKQGIGDIHVNMVDLSGPLLQPDLWKYNIAGTGIGINVTSHPDKNEIENLSGQYHISNDIFSFKKIFMKMDDLSWMEKFIEKKHYDSLLIPLVMENGNLYISNENSFLNSDLEFMNGPRVNIDLTFKKPSVWVLNAVKVLDTGISDATVNFNHNPQKPLIAFNGIFKTETLNKILTPGSFWAQKIEDVTEKQPILIYTDKDAVLNIIIKQLNLNSLFSHSKPILLNHRLIYDREIHFKTDFLKIKTFSLTDIDSKLTFKKDRSIIRLNNALLCDIETKGDITLKQDLMYADIPFKATNKTNIQNLLTCLFQKDDFMDGQYSLTGKILSNGAKKDALATLTGSFAFTAEEGRIYKLTLLSRILSVLNVSKFFKGKIPDITQKGFAYKKIVIDGDFKDNKVYLTKAIIDGNDMTLIFNGWIDPINDMIDLTCLVAPFKTIDLIIEKIPIVNTVLGGRLVSVPVQATGKLSDPTVIPLHPSAVGQGLVNMMTDILKSPIRLWDKVNGE